MGSSTKPRKKGHQTLKNSLQTVKPKRTERDLAEDEDIDDDLAFNEEDEAMYGDYFATQQTTETKPQPRRTKKKGRQEVDEGEDDGDGFVDLEQLLSDNVFVDKSQTHPGSHTKPRHKSTKKHVEEALDHTEKDAPLSSLATAVWSQLSDAARDRIERFQSAALVPAATEIRHEAEAEDRSHTREDVHRRLKSWDGVVHRMQQADHIQFPLRSSGTTRTRHTGSTIASPLAPSTPLERRIAELLGEAGLDTSSGRKGHHGDDVTPDIPFAQNRGKDQEETNDDEKILVSGDYLAKLKAVMSYNLQKRKRRNKIRSKAYHRQMRKEKEKLEERRLRALHETDPAAAMEKRRQKLEKLRAIERVTMKHKNTSKWVRHVKKSAKWDANVRVALGEEQRLHQKLMTKAQESAIADESEESDGALEDVARHITSEKFKKKVGTVSNPGVNPSSAESLLMTAQEDSTNPFSKARIELLGMQFMKSAQRKRELEALEAADDMDDDVEITDPEGSYASFVDSGGCTRRKLSDSTSVRQKYAGPQQNEAVIVQLPGVARSTPAQKGPTHPSETSPVATKIVEQEVVPDISIPDSLFGVAPISPKPDCEAQITPGTQIEENMRRVREAFAADDVFDDLQREKDEALRQDATPIDPNEALPGWNEWGGLDPYLNKRQKERITRLELRRRAEIEHLRKQRRDSKLAHVFINDMVDKHPEKFKLKSIPYPYETAEQYHRAMRMPIGKEWNTELTVKQLTRPAVAVRKGVLVTPLDDGVRRKHAPKSRLQIKKEAEKRGGKRLARKKKAAAGKSTAVEATQVESTAEMVGAS